MATASSKRRRTDGEIHTQELGQYEAVPPQFINHRQNRWLSGQLHPADEGQTSQELYVAGFTIPSERTSSNEPWGVAHAGPARGPSHIDAHFTSAHHIGPAGALQSRQRPVPAPTQQHMLHTNAIGSRLVQYDSPMSTIPSVPENVMTNSHIASHKGALSSQPSLPSPAPSEEISIDPPSISRDPLRPSSTTTAAATPPTRTSVSRSAGSDPLPHAAQRSSTTCQPMPTSTGQFYRSSAPQIVERTLANGQPSPAPPVMTAHAHPRSSPLVRMPRSPANHLLAQIDLIETKLRDREVLHLAEKGRITLLREAVQKGDGMYLILNQLFCLQTMDPNSLPESMKMMDPNNYQVLSTLLASNEDVDRQLLHFSSRFPEPLMSIYSSADPGVRLSFEQVVGAVRAFLHVLPPSFQYLVDTSKHRSTPPSVHDLAEVLHLRSRVMQTTAFLAITRMLYGANHPGLDALQHAHRLDSDMHHIMLLRRLPAGKEKLHSIFKRIVEESVAHANLVGSRQTPDRPYQLPEQIRLELSSHSDVQHLNTTSHSNTSGPQARYVFLQQNLHQAQAQLGRASPHVPGLSGPPPPQPRQTLLSQPAFPYVQQLDGHSAHALRPRRLYPGKGDPLRALPLNPDSSRDALHQAHLRSPVLGPTFPPFDNQRLYQYVTGYGLPPTRLSRSLPQQMIVFPISQDAYDKLPQMLAPATSGEPIGYKLDEGTQTYRLRFSMLPAHGFGAEDSWVTAENVWPEGIDFELNGKILEKRRKLHYGRYLPIHLTQLVRPGENILKVYTNHATRSFDSKAEYALAVEAIGVMSHESIRDNLRRLTAKDVLDDIKHALSGDVDANDDMAVTSSTMTINLLDPFSASDICQTPVRGASCLHRNCFDLEIFLSQCKRKHPGWPSVIDCWRCPHCRGDIRPHTLVVDEFLIEVREELEKRDLLETRAIVVGSDGQWNPRKEERTGVRSASLDREEAQAAAAARGHPKPSVREIIEID